MNGSTLIGSPRHKSRRSLERLVVLTQSSVLPTQLGELSPLLGRQTGPVTGIGLGLDHPRPHCRLTEVEVPGHLADAAIAALTALDDLSLELRGERPTRTGLLPFHSLHFEHPFRGCAPDGGCPSNRRKPTLIRRGSTLRTPRSPVEIT